MNVRFDTFFSYGFRPFFLMGGLYAVIAVVPWAVKFMPIGDQGLMGLPTPTIEWHAHEMLFGYASAIIAGFFLTAVPSWTKRKPVSGKPLMALALLWALGRLVNWLPDQVPGVVAAIIDSAFVPLLVALVIRALIAGWSKRNLIFLPIFAGLFAANVMVHLDRLGIADGIASQGHRLALDLIVALIIVLGGRVIPAFTTNFLRNHGETVLPHQSDMMTRLAVLSAAAMVIANQVSPDSLLSGTIIALAAIINTIRFAGWRGHRILRFPILWILFLGYGFMILGLAADAMAILGNWLPRTAADHLLTIGGVGCMTLGVMTRAALGHTGRTPHASPAMVVAFIALGIAALLRTFGPVFWPEHYAVTMATVGVMWIAAFSIFSITFWPILTRPRTGQ